MEEWIIVGWISVNGVIVQIGQSVVLIDKVKIGGCLVNLCFMMSWILCVVMYYKLEGEIVLCDDLEGCLLVFVVLLCICSGCWVVVGCLDFNMLGLLLFIILGELVNKMMYLSLELVCDYVV